MNILKYPDNEAELRKVSEKVTDEEISSNKFAVAIKEMNALLKEENGIGLAAPQVGILKRFFLIKMPGEAARVFINPVILDKRGSVTFTESCLSIPDTIGPVVRYSEIKLAWKDFWGRTKVQTYKTNAKSIWPICIQHEYDHLDGILFLDKAKNILVEKDDKPKVNFVIDDTL